MVTLRRPPQYQRKGPALEPYQVILRPLITEKATHLSERHNAYTFEVNSKANKTEIKEAVEALFNVKVADVRTQNRRGKLRRYRLKVGRMRNWKKAIVALHEEYRIDSIDPIRWSPGVRRAGARGSRGPHGGPDARKPRTESRDGYPLL